MTQLWLAVFALTLWEARHVPRTLRLLWRAWRLRAQARPVTNVWPAVATDGFGFDGFVIQGDVQCRHCALPLEGTTALPGTTGFLHGGDSYCGWLDCDVCEVMPGWPNTLERERALHALDATAQAVTAHRTGVGS